MIKHNRFLKNYLIFVFISTMYVFGQSKIALQIGSNSEILNEDVISKNWRTGITVNLDIDLKITKRLSFSPGLQYAYHSFDEYRSAFITIPERRLQSATGNPSRLFRVWIDIKAIASNTEVLAFGFSTGVGWTTEKLGSIKALWLYNKVPEPIKTVNFLTRHYLFHTFGTFLEIELAERVGLNSAVRCYTNYDDKFYLNLLFGAHYCVSK